MIRSPGRAAEWVGVRSRGRAIALGLSAALAVIGLVSVLLGAPVFGAASFVLALLLAVRLISSRRWPVERQQQVGGSPRGLRIWAAVSLIVAIGLGIVAALILAGALAPRQPGVWATLAFLGAAAAFLFGRLFGAYARTLDRVRGIVGDDEEILAVCIGSLRSRPPLTGAVAVATPHRVTAVQAALLKDPQILASIQFRHLTRFEAEADGFRASAGSKELSMSRCLPSQVAEFSAAVEARRR